MVVSALLDVVLSVICDMSCLVRLKQVQELDISRCNGVDAAPVAKVVADNPALSNPLPVKFIDCVSYLLDKGVHALVLFQEVHVKHRAFESLHCWWLVSKLADYDSDPEQMHIHWWHAPDVFPVGTGEGSHQMLPTLSSQAR